ncbi:MAG: ABC transporter substrate-binding protein [Sporomusaceae bacterium]|nr:ABC transporter substrate-binding protein [Sporomusaceae bacterium]
MRGYDRVVQESWHESQASLRPVRCAFCNRLLFRGAVEKIEIKCPKCGAVQTFQRNGDDWISERSRPHPRANRQGCGRERMVTDSAGRLVAIPERPQRVVILNSSNLGLFLAAGGKPVGRGDGDALPDALAAAVTAIPGVGQPTDPDLARIMALQPDLVIGMAVPAHQSLAVVLERKGIPMLLQTFARYHDVLESLRFYGELNGKRDLAMAKITAIEQHRRQLVELTGGRPAPRALIVWAIAGGLYTALSTSFIGDLLKRLGGVNVADLLAPTDEKLSYTPLDFAAVAAVQPEVILFIDHRFDGPADKKIEAALRNPQWTDLKAVRQNRVCRLPYSLFAVNPGAQLEEALNVLAGALYPK